MVGAVCEADLREDCEIMRQHFRGDGSRRGGQKSKGRKQAFRDKTFSISGNVPLQLRWRSSSTSKGGQEKKNESGIKALIQSRIGLIKELKAKNSWEQGLADNRNSATGLGKNSNRTGHLGNA